MTYWRSVDMSNLVDGVVLDNELFIKYHEFLNDTSKLSKTIRHLFHFMKGGRVVTCTKQYTDTGLKLQMSLQKALTKAKLTDLSLEEVAQRTPYKIILSESSSTFPYVNINDDDEKIENDLVGSYEKDDDRQKAIMHLKSLCQRASHVVIYDKYISRDSTQEHTDINFLEKILPKKVLLIDCFELNDTGKTDLESRCSDWRVTVLPGSASHHDRYIIIDQKVEIILSSGLYHVENKDMDFTYIVRYIGKKKKRF